MSFSKIVKREKLKFHYFSTSKIKTPKKYFSKDTKRINKLAEIELKNMNTIFPEKRSTKKQLPKKPKIKSNSISPAVGQYNISYSQIYRRVSITRIREVGQRTTKQFDRSDYISIELPKDNRGISFDKQLGRKESRSISPHENRFLSFEYPSKSLKNQSPKFPSSPARDPKVLMNELTPLNNPNKEPVLPKLHSEINLKKMSPRKFPLLKLVLHDYDANYSSLDKHIPNVDLRRYSTRDKKKRQKGFLNYNKINYLRKMP